MKENLISAMSKFQDSSYYINPRILKIPKNNETSQGR